MHSNWYLENWTANLADKSSKKKLHHEAFLVVWFIKTKIHSVSLYRWTLFFRFTCVAMLFSEVPKHIASQEFPIEQHQQRFSRNNINSFEYKSWFIFATKQQWSQKKRRVKSLRKTCSWAIRIGFSLYSASLYLSLMVGAMIFEL